MKVWCEDNEVTESEDEEVEDTRLQRCDRDESEDESMERFLDSMQIDKPSSKAKPDQWAQMMKALEACQEGTWRKAQG